MSFKSKGKIYFPSETAGRSSICDEMALHCIATVQYPENSLLFARLSDSCCEEGHRFIKPGNALDKLNFEEKV
jgi:hypothetical protein